MCGKRHLLAQSGVPRQRPLSHSCRIRMARSRGCPQLIVLGRVAYSVGHASTWTGRGCTGAAETTDGSTCGIATLARFQGGTFWCLMRSGDDRHRVSICYLHEYELSIFPPCTTSACLVLLALPCSQSLRSPVSTRHRRQNLWCVQPLDALSTKSNRSGLYLWGGGYGGEEFVETEEWEATSAERQVVS